MRRVPDWPSRLAAAIEAARGRPFCWGAHDCLLFAAGVVQAITGVDPAAEWRGRYDSRASAVHHLATRGGMEAVVTVSLGSPRAYTVLAQRGDVVMVQTPDGPALGICNGADAACAGPLGLTFAPMTRWLRAWQV